MGAVKRASLGTNAVAIPSRKAPSITTISQPGSDVVDSTVVMPVAGSVTAWLDWVTWLQPKAPANRMRTKSTPVAVTVPPTVISRWPTAPVTLPGLPGRGGGAPPRRDRPAGVVLVDRLLPGGIGEHRITGIVVSSVRVVEWPRLVGSDLGVGVVARRRLCVESTSSGAVCVPRRRS